MSGPAFADRTGGYTRIIKLSDYRIGDAGSLVLLQLLTEESKPRGTARRSAGLRRKRNERRHQFASKVSKKDKGEKSESRPGRKGRRRHEQHLRLFIQIRIERRVGSCEGSDLFFSRGSASPDGWKLRPDFSFPQEPPRGMINASCPVSHARRTTSCVLSLDRVGDC